MTEATRGLMAECLHCGVSFVPRKAGHVFHSIACRHRGARAPHERKPIDEEQIARLFDPKRDPSERCRLDDWFCPADADESIRALYLYDTVGERRRWYRNLEQMGRL